MNPGFIQKQFTQPILKWYDQHGRKHLPWQLPKDPYRIWISEIMLQQTQVQTVIPYFNRFMQRFPRVHDLAMAEEDEVLSLWSGLGYYSRARNLHYASKIINQEYNGIFPTDLHQLINLPGIGRTTAAAILSLAFNQPTPILDGNVKRVLARFFLIKGHPEQSETNKTFWHYASLCMPQERCGDYTQAIMDMGSTCCTIKKPNCSACPVQSQCLAYKNNEQHLYPNKKIKKPIPTYEQQFLVLQNKQGLIYLEKRPPTGLWSGLWCFPSIDTATCPTAYIKSNYGLNIETPELISSFDHQFSHFRLKINALRIKTHNPRNLIFETGGRWFSQEQLTGLGLAKPTSYILSLL